MWNEEKYKNYLNELLKLKDEKYLKFTKKLTNTKVEMIGVQIPKLRKIAKDISKTDIDSFIKEYKGIYFEERMILGFVISLSNTEYYKKYLELYSTQILDWSLCDSVACSLKNIKYDKEYFFKFVQKMIKTNNEFQTRFGIVILLNHYLNDEYIDKVIKTILKIKSNYYYVNMALAWMLAEIYIKYPIKIDKYISKDYLNEFVLNKTILKICDSFRVSTENKENLKQRRMKKELL